MSLISYLTEIHFDFGAVGELSAELRRLGIRSPLVVTDRGIIASGLFDRVSVHLPALAPGQIFDQTPANPTQTAVRDATARFLRHGCDGIVALGGGSPIDLAKAVALMATHPGTLPEYSAAEGGSERIGPQAAPVVAIGTTSGTGSEVGRAAVIVMEDGRKLGVISRHLLPKSAICDPELTLGLPPALTAGTGMDAISHCIETFLSPRINPPADAIALDGLARAVKNIERAQRQGQDRPARWEMMMASVQGGLAFQKGLGAVHAMSHPLGALRDPLLHHGTVNAVVLPAVLRFNRDFVGDKYQRIRRALDLREGTDLAAYFSELNGRLGLPRSLGAMGVPRALLPHLAEAAEKDHTSQTNPRPADAALYQALFEESY